MVKEKNRILSYDVLRIIAIVMVVMVHVSGTYMVNSPPRSADFTWGTLCNSISRIGVNLFVMLSGALLLNEDKEVDGASMVRRVVKTAGLLVAWSGFYAVVFRLLIPLAGHRPVDLGDFVRGFLRGHYHLWFLYMVLGLYLITPILRLWVRRENSRYVLYFIGLSAVFRFLVPPVSFLMGRFLGNDTLIREVADNFRMEFVSPMVTFYLLGWYLSTRELRHRGWLYGLGLGGLLLSQLGTWVFTTEEVKACRVLLEEDSILLLAYSGALFVLVRSLLQGRELPRARSWIIRLSQGAFGVYAVHEAVRQLLLHWGFEGLPGSTILLQWAAVTVISYAVTLTASHIPGIRHLFRF